MKGKAFILAGILFIFVICSAIGQGTFAQIPNQLAQDFVAGTVPSAGDVAKYEKDSAAKPDDLHLTRKLGKAYFFQFFGGGNAAAASKAQKTLERALTLRKDDPETLAYLGALHVFAARRLHKENPEMQKTEFEKGFELLQLAEKVDPNHGAVVSIASASYIILPDSYAMAPHVVEMLEGMRKGMGPMFARFSHHGQQRLLLTLGQAFVKTGATEKARAAFDEALKINENSREAGLIKAEIARLNN
ncbi:MAG: tetratricopeptide repeat protein [Pyrinomonadaceae bacterium]